MFTSKRGRIRVALPVTVIFLFLWNCSPPGAAGESGFDPFAGNEPANALLQGDASDDGPVIPMMQFSDETITSAFQMISDFTGWSIFPTAEVSKAKISHKKIVLTPSGAPGTGIAPAAFDFVPPMV